MTREEILSQAKRVILPVVTIREIKLGIRSSFDEVIIPQIDAAEDVTYTVPVYHGMLNHPNSTFFYLDKAHHPLTHPVVAPYYVGQLLYLAESWQKYKGRYYYRTDNHSNVLDFKLARDMPKKAARIFLRVIDCRPVKIDAVWHWCVQFKRLFPKPKRVRRRSR